MIGAYFRMQYLKEFLREKRNRKQRRVSTVTARTTEPSGPACQCVTRR